MEQSAHLQGLVGTFRAPLGPFFLRRPVADLTKALVIAHSIFFFDLIFVKSFTLKISFLVQKFKKRGLQKKTMDGFLLFNVNPYVLGAMSYVVVSTFGLIIMAATSGKAQPYQTYYGNALFSAGAMVCFANSWNALFAYIFINLLKNVSITWVDESPEGVRKRLVEAKLSVQKLEQQLQAGTRKEK
jgi:hypothetical protein